jgi:hypothetical protein
MGSTAMLRGVVKALLWLRYRVEVRGVEAVRARGDRKILFLPNHPALIDPVIVLSSLHKDFRPIPLANGKRTDLPVIGWMARRVGTVLIPDLTAPNRREMREVARGLELVRRSLEEGANVLLYPGGRLAREPEERLGRNGAVERLLKAVPARAWSWCASGACGAAASAGASAASRTSWATCPCSWRRWRRQESWACPGGGWCLSWSSRRISPGRRAAPR